MGVTVGCRRFTALSCPPRRSRTVYHRYVENELLGMKSLFENKEACLRRELSEERDKLASEIDVLKQQLEQAEAGRAAAEVCFAPLP